MRKASVFLKELHSVLKPRLLEAVCVLSCPYSNSSSQVSILSTPKVSLFDQKVNIKVQGLPTKAKVTLHSSVERQWRQKPVKFVACGHYVSNQLGDVDVNKDESLGGTYTGVEPMGLFWSVEADPSGPSNIRMVKRPRDVEQPLDYNLAVYPGHLSLDDLHMTQNLPPPSPVAMASLKRLVKGTNVRRLPVREGSVRGTLFLPPGEGPFPAVIDMFGFAGGLMESRAALLASHGIAALSLAFFHYEDLPPSIQDVNFSYFEEAVKWLTSHLSVKEGGIGVVAVSGGASFALTMAWLLPKVTAVVLINPSPFLNSDLYHGDQLVHRGVNVDIMHILSSTNGMMSKISWLSRPELMIPVWESQTQVLTLLSDDDKQIPPEVGDAIYARYPEDKHHLMEVVHYPGAGHLLEPPYTAHCWACYNPPSRMDLIWGGNKIAHAKAQDDAWKRTLNFLNTYLQ